MELNIRRATIKDLEFLFNLRNEPSVRQVSLNSAPISLEIHRQWFEKKLANNNTLIFIVEVDSNPIAQVRFDVMNGNEAEISIAVAASSRGKGYGSKILKEASAQFLNSFSEVNKINAFINLGNEASLHSFTNAGYEHKERVDEGGVVRYKMVLLRGYH